MNDLRRYLEKQMTDRGVLRRTRSHQNRVRSRKSTDRGKISFEYDTKRTGGTLRHPSVQYQPHRERNLQPYDLYPAVISPRTGQETFHQFPLIYCCLQNCNISGDSALFLHPSYQNAEYRLWSESAGALIPHHFPKSELLLTIFRIFISGTTLIST